MADSKTTAKKTTAKKTTAKTTTAREADRPRAAAPTEDQRKKALEARVVEQLKAGATTFAEDQCALIAEKFGVKNTEHPYGNVWFDEPSPTAGVENSGDPHPLVAAYDKDKKGK